MGSHPAKSRQESGGVWTVICPGKQHFANLLDSSRPAPGLLHTEEVTGSIPVSPTRSEPYADLSKDHRGSHSCSGPHDFFGEDPVGLLHGGQLEFLLGAEVRVQAARAHPGRRAPSKG
jgi:hypothetical protein